MVNGCRSLHTYTYGYVVPPAVYYTGTVSESPQLGRPMGQPGVELPLDAGMSGRSGRGGVFQKQAQAQAAEAGSPPPVTSLLSATLL